MNLTAKKLRVAADYTKGDVVTLVQAIRHVREQLDVEETDSFGGDLGAVLDFIADELDELQARAAGADCLRQKLESAEAKAERRKKQVEYTEDAIRERNARLKKRGERIVELTSEVAELRKQVPSEREREILDMWPRFEDGEPVMVGDKYEDNDGMASFATEVQFDIDGPSLVDLDGFHDAYRNGKRVKRPVQSVLDADGVEIKVGDTVWHEDGTMLRVDGFGGIEDGETIVNVHIVRGATPWRAVRSLSLTHTRPESWERLEEDAEKGFCEYFGFEDRLCDAGEGCPAYKQGSCAMHKAKDIVRRAKALAGIEVDE